MSFPPYGGAENAAEMGCRKKVDILPPYGGEENAPQDGVQEKVDILPPYGGEENVTILCFWGAKKCWIFNSAPQIDVLGVQNDENSGFLAKIFDFEPILHPKMPILHSKIHWRQML